MLLSLRHKLLLGFLALGVLPIALVALYVNRTNNAALVESAGSTLQAHADALMDKIDRNLFERYGDVQAFAFHPKARGTPDQVQTAADFYTKAYVIYDLMLVCDLEGTIVATNTIGYDGTPIDTAAIVGQSVASEPWFQRIKSGAVKAGETLYDSPPQQDPFVRAAYGDERVTLAYSAPIFDDEGKIVRIWSNRVSWERVVGQIMDEFLEQQRAEGGAAITAHVVDRENRILHGATTPNGKLETLAGTSIAAGKTGHVVEPDAASGAELVTGFSASNGALGFAGYRWGVTLSQDQDAVLVAGGGLARVLLVACALTALVVVSVGLAMATRITQPILRVESGLSRMAAGDFSASVDVTRNDELGRMAGSFNTATEGLRTALSDVQVSASEFVGVSQQLSLSSTRMSDGSQQQASALEETAASLEEITGTIKQNADSARQASQLAQSSREIAERGGRVVSEAVESIKEINRSSEKIANIITTIDEIAFQTNLLALNAAVEAARAGEQGRGFAVVASEVRNLAQRSASSAKEIKALIEESLQKVSAGSELVDRSGKSLEEIVASVKRVTEIIAEIAAASQEQATGVDQVNRAITQMDQVVQANAGQANQLAQTATSLSAQAQQLQELVERFHLDGSHAPTHVASQGFVPDVPPGYVAEPHGVAPMLPSRSARPAAGHAHRAHAPAPARETVAASGHADGFIEF